MKRLLNFLLLYFISIGLHAQNHISFGLKAGAGLATQKISPLIGEKSPVITFNISSFADVPICAWFSLQPGLSLQGKGVKTDMGKVQDINDGGKLNLMYVEIPVNLLLKLPLKNKTGFYAGTGGYYGFGLTGKMKYDSGAENNKIFESRPGLNGYQRTDYGLNFLAGSNLSRQITIDMQYSCGLFNISPKPNTASVLYPPGYVPQRGEIKNRVTSLSIAYSF